MAEEVAPARAIWRLGDYHRFALEQMWAIGPIVVQACGISSGRRVLDWRRAAVTSPSRRRKFWWSSCRPAGASVTGSTSARPASSPTASSRGRTHEKAKLRSKVRRRTLDRSGGAAEPPSEEAANRGSRRPDSNRGPLHYER